MEEGDINNDKNFEINTSSQQNNENNVHTSNQNEEQYENQNQNQNQTQSQNENKNEYPNENKTEQRNENKNENQNNYKREYQKDKEINKNQIIDFDLELLKAQTIHELEKYNSELKEENEKLKEENEKLREGKNITVDTNKFNKKISELEKELKQEKKKNEELIQNIKKLEKELEEAKKNNLNEKNEKTEKKEENNMPMDSGKQTDGELQKQYFVNMIEKDKEISELKKELEKYKKLAEGKDFISLIFVKDDKEYYSIVCKKTDKLYAIEDKLKEKFLNSDNNYEYYFKEEKVPMNKAFKQVDINNGDIIIVKEDKTI